MTRLLKNIIKLLIKILSYMSLMKNWIWHWNKWNWKCKMWKRTAKISWGNYQKSAVFAIIWSKWISPISLWHMIRLMWALMQLPIVSQLLNHLFNNNNSRTNNSNHLLSLNLQIRPWKTVQALIQIIKDKIRAPILDSQNYNNL